MSRTDHHSYKWGDDSLVQRPFLRFGKETTTARRGENRNRRARARQALRNKKFDAIALTWDRGTSGWISW